MRLDDKVGRIAPGMRADLVLLGEDPRKELSAVCNVKGVIFKGRIIHGFSKQVV